MERSIKQAFKLGGVSGLIKRYGNTLHRGKRLGLKQKIWSEECWYYFKCKQGHAIHKQKEHGQGRCCKQSQDKKLSKFGGIYDVVKSFQVLQEWLGVLGITLKPPTEYKCEYWPVQVQYESKIWMLREYYKELTV